MVFKRGDEVKSKFFGWLIHGLFLCALAWGITQPESVVMSAAACWVIFTVFLSLVLMAVGIFGYLVFYFCEIGTVQPGKEEMPQLICKVFGLDKPSSWRQVVWPLEVILITGSLLYSGWFVTAVIYLISVVTFRFVRSLMKGLLLEWRESVKTCPAS